MSRLRRQMSYNASLSYMTVTSVCSSNEWTHNTVLYGSTTAVATWGQAQIVKLNFDSLPEINCSGWNNWRYVPVRTSSTTVGSRSTKTARGTCFPAPVSEKKVLKASSPPPIVLSLGI